jgi:transposase
MAFFEGLAPCLVGMEACATAQHWARELTKLGHEVRLMPAKDVKAYVKRNKNDAADAEAICEAVRRPTMRFVQVKSAEQQGQLMQHRTRDLLMRQRTQLINALRAHLAELGIVAAQGREGVKQLLAIVASERDPRLPVDELFKKMTGVKMQHVTPDRSQFLWRQAAVDQDARTISLREDICLAPRPCSVSRAGAARPTSNRSRVWMLFSPK